MKNIKSYNQFNESKINEHLYNDFGGQYLSLERLPNGIKISLTEEGKTKVLDEGISEDTFIDYFDDIRGNSELDFHYDLGSMGFGLTEAPGITDGYYYDDEDTYTDGDNEDSEVYYYDDYMLKDFTKELADNGFVIFHKA